MVCKIEVKRICKNFGKITVLKDISLSVQEGQFVSILGPSGCGKSTLFEIISGLQYPDRGEVFIDGGDCRGVTGRVSYMPQKDLLFPWKTVLDNVAVPLVIQGDSWKEARLKASSYFKPFSLDGFEKMYPGQLSGGMKQRAALLRAFLFSKDILLLDEPFGALDAITRGEMHLWLMKIYERFRPSVLFITHDIDEALFLADKVIIFSARPAEVIKEFSVDIPRPRKQQTIICPQFLALKKQILALLKGGGKNVF